MLCEALQAGCLTGPDSSALAQEASESGAGLASSCPPGRGWGGHCLVWGDHHAQWALETRCQAPLKVDITEQSPAGEKEMAAQ